jgi:hypothetical protein
MSDEECQDDGDYNDENEESESLNDSPYYEEDYSEPSTPSPRWTDIAHCIYKFHSQFNVWR